MATLIELGKFATVVNITLRYVRGGEIQPLWNFLRTSWKALPLTVQLHALLHFTPSSYGLLLSLIGPIGFINSVGFMYKLTFLILSRMLHAV